MEKTGGGVLAEPIFTAMAVSSEHAKFQGVPVRTWLVTVTLSIVLIHVYLRIIMVPQYRSELGGVEHNVIHGVQKLLLDIPLYQDPEEVPFDVIQYTPAYHVLSAAVGKVMGIGWRSPHQVFVLSRVLSLLWTMLASWVAYRIVRRGSGRVELAVLAAGLCFCTYTEHFYSRPDSLASLASLTTVLLFLGWIRLERPLLLIATAAAGTLAVLSKQSGLLILGVPALFLVLQRDRVGFTRYCLAALFFAALGGGLMMIHASPVVLWKNLVLGLKNGYSTMMWGELFEPATYKYFIGWHLLGIWIVIQGWRSKEPMLRFMALVVPLAVIFGLVTGLKSGSRMNYLHEGLVLTFIGTAICLGQARQVRATRALRWGFILYGLVFMAWRTKSVDHWANLGDSQADQHAAYRADAEVYDTIVHRLGLEADEFVYITYRDHLEHFFVGRSLLTQKDILQFSRAPVFDLTRFFQAMEDGTARYIISDEPFPQLEVQGRPLTGWSPIGVVAGRTIWGRSPGP